MKITFRCVPGLDSILPEPVPARRGLPDWLKDMPLNAFSVDFDQSVETVKKCPPFIDAMTAGFLMPLACDVQVDKGRFHWNWTELPAETPSHTPRTPVSMHISDQVVDTPLFDDNRLVVKFMNFWTIELEAGFSLLVTHPFNRVDLPFRTLAGLVNADVYKDNYTHFPAVWMDPSFTGVLAKVTPVAQCVPVPRQSMDLVFERMDGDAESRLVELQSEIEVDRDTYRRRFRGMD
jgi:hypothetical protein